MVLFPILRLIYFFFRLLTAAATTVYYRRYTVLGRRHTQFHGPAIVVSNHPSTLMDPLNSALHIRQEMFFLANYGLFKHPLSAWLFTQLYCIPVKRREDVGEGEVRNNDEAFEKSYQHMEHGGLLYIAAEGVSWMHRWVRNFKTGTARIAFGTEQRNDWKLGIKIIPVGLDYSAANLFRSDVTVHYGEPVIVQHWEAAFRENPEAAVNALTEHLQQRVTALTVNARDEAGEATLQVWETIARHDAPLAGDADQRRSQYFANVLLDDAALRSATTQYSSGLAATSLTDLGIKQYATPPNTQQQTAEWIFLVLSFPFFALGYAAWWLPCQIPAQINKHLGLYIGYSPAVKILAGIFTIPLGLWAATKVLPWSGYFHTWPVSLLWLLLLGAGVFAEHYLDVWVRIQARWAARRQPAQADGLARQRAHIAARLSIR